TVAWQFEKQRHMNGLVVQKYSVCPFSVFAEGLSMIGHDSNERAVIKSLGAQGGKQVSDRGVNVGDFSVIGKGGIALRVRRRWIVGIMRVVKMDPQEKRPLRCVSQPAQGMTNNHIGPALHGFIAVLVGPAQAVPGVIKIE